jgi:hypothetical protein
MNSSWTRTTGWALFALSMALLHANSAHAVLKVLTPGDPIVPIDRDVVTLASSYPANESPSKAIDDLYLPATPQTSTKYLNFGRFSTGFIIDPGFGPSIVQSFRIDSANDNEPRDPATYELYGSNDPMLMSGDNSEGSLENWTLINSGSLSLPAGRRATGPIVQITNNTSYNLYRMVFPTLKFPNAATAMQIGEVSFFESADGTGSDIFSEFDDIRAIKRPTPPVSESISPLTQGPENALDGNVNSKYLNFGVNNTGFIVTPSRGSEIVNAFQITTANDTEGRDPTSFQIYGTNDSITSGVHTSGETENWTLVASGNITLPAARLTPGDVVSFANPTAYNSYKIIFPTIKGPLPTITSMQIANIQFYADGTDVPGDYNGDGDVDNEDYGIWRGQFGFSGPGLNGDGNDDGLVDAADYVIWRANTTGSGSLQAAATVPEPACWLIALPALVAFAVQRRRATS